MKTALAFLIFFGAAIYFIIRERDENALLKDQVAALTEQLAIAGLSPDGQPSTQAGPKRLTCPTCNGSGNSTQRGTNPNGKPYSPQRCPICLGSGKREFDLPPGAELCTTCRGMGKRMTEPGKSDGLRLSTLDTAATATTCSPCLGKGFIRRGAK
ncbi:MAG: hypothetical protein ABMA13_14925 [Chthoniobacteraceae bacterium]